MMYSREIAGSKSGKGLTVFVRFRPLSRTETADNNESLEWSINESNIIEKTANGQRVYNFDYCFGPSVSNASCYDVIGKAIVANAMEGKSGTIMTYGEKDSGKTWSMKGNERFPGILILCFHDVMDWVETHTTKTYSLKATYLEVRNEEINDLLGEYPVSHNLRLLSEDVAGGYIVEHMTEQRIQSFDDFMAVLKRGEDNKILRGTQRSSAHTILRITIELSENNVGVNERSDSQRISHLCLVDLAGHESSEGFSANLLKDFGNSSNSLVAMENVINKLRETPLVRGKQDSIIPYRDSQLTSILKQTLGGNCDTRILCTCSLAASRKKETIATLNFGQSCKSIQDLGTGISEIDEGNYVAGDNTTFQAPSSTTFGSKLGLRVNTLQGGSTDSKEDNYAYEHRDRFQEERQKLQDERLQLLSERTSLEERENRLGLLMANLDEKDSKLRQTLKSLKEQQEQWKRTIMDLQRREELLEDWNRSHGHREARLTEMSSDQEQRFEELRKREGYLAESEQKFLATQKEIQEQELRLQEALAKIANREQQFLEQEKMLQEYEASIRKREGANDLRDRELIVRKREMESWDMLLREKDRKLGIERTSVDEKAELLRTAEDRARQREVEVEKKLIELRQNEGEVAELKLVYTTKLTDLEGRERNAITKTEKLEKLEEELHSREADLNAWEKGLQQLSTRLQGLDNREDDLMQRIELQRKTEDEFFNVRVAAITSRHAQEVLELEKMITQQLKIVSNFQTELDKVKADLSSKCTESEEFKSMLRERDALIQQLREEVKAATLGGSVKTTTASRFTGLADGQARDPSLLGATSKLPRSTILAINVDSNTFFNPFEPINVDSSDDEAEAHMSTPGKGLLKRGGGASSNLSNSSSNNNLGGSAAKQTKSKTTKDFLTQLAETQKAIHNILAMHNAVPDKAEPILRRNNSKTALNMSRTSSTSPSLKTSPNLIYLQNALVGRQGISASNSGSNIAQSLSMESMGSLQEQRYSPNSLNGNNRDLYSFHKQQQQQGQHGVPKSPRISELDDVGGANSRSRSYMDDTPLRASTARKSVPPIQIPTLEMLSRIGSPAGDGGNGSPVNSARRQSSSPGALSGGSASNNSVSMAAQYSNRGKGIRGSAGIEAGMSTSPDVSSMIEKSRRDGIPVAKISLSGASKQQRVVGNSNSSSVNNAPTNQSK